MTVFSPTCFGVGVGLPLGLGLVAPGSGSVSALALEAIGTTINASFSSTTATTVSGVSSVALNPTLHGDQFITPTAFVTLPTGPPPPTTLETITILDIPLPIPIPSVMITLTDNATTVTVAVTSTIFSTVSPSSPHDNSSISNSSSSNNNGHLSTGFIVPTVFACLGASWFIFCVVVLLVLRHQQHQKDRRRDTAAANPQHGQKEDGYSDTINLGRRHHHATDTNTTTTPYRASPASPAFPSPTLQSTPINAPSPPALNRRRTRPHLWLDAILSTPPSRYRTSSLVAIPPSPTPSPASASASVSMSMSVIKESASPPPAVPGASFMTPEEIERWGRFGEDINPQPDEYWSILSFGDASEVFGLVERPVGVRHSV